VRILVVDDEVKVCSLLRMMLEEMGHEVMVTIDAAAVVPLVDKRYYDLVLLDINMPHLSGIEVIQRLRARNRLIKIIVVTAVDNAIARQYIEELGIDGYVVKPFKYDYLRRVLKEQIDSLPKP